MDRTLALGFLDLVEVRFVDAFRRAGISWARIRAVYDYARTEFGTHHPFCARRFKTDGREFFADAAEKGLVEVSASQLFFQRTIAPYLKELVFGDVHATSWWPLGPGRAVVLDPRRAFGKPIVSSEGVPTWILASAFRTEGSVERVARWYDVAQGSVRDAVEYEKQLAAA